MKIWTADIPLPAELLLGQQAKVPCMSLLGLVAHCDDVVDATAERKKEL